MVTDDLSRVKFEVVLPMAEARRVLEDMSRQNCRNKADHVRRCLLARNGARDDELSYQLGAIALAVNALNQLHGDGGAAWTPDMKRLSLQLRALVKKTQGLLNERGQL